jgi:hypothetical protein
MDEGEDIPFRQGTWQKQFFYGFSGKVAEET